MFKAISKKLQGSLQFIKRHRFRILIYPFLGVLVSLFALYLLTYYGAFGRIPSAMELKSLKNPVTSTIYARDGSQIGTFFFQNRTNIDSTQLTSHLVHALIATEDARFYEHHGVDYKSYARVFIKSVLMGKNAGGGSTIPQQIAKNLFGRKKQAFLSTPINKIREIIVARRLEVIYNKQDLLLLYFNTVSFGENLYGIAKASQRFFSKAPIELTLSESATLIGVLKAPSYYNPKNFPARAESRRNVVLQQMHKYGYIDDSTLIAAKTPLELDYQPSVKVSSFANYFKEYVRAEFEQWAKAHPKDDGSLFNVEIDGLKLFTTLDPYVQKYIESGMLRQINRLQADMRHTWTSATIQGGKDTLLQLLIDRHPQVKLMREESKSDEDIARFVQSKKPRKYWELGVGYQEKELSLADSLVEAITRLHTGILAMNAKSGAIMGYLGGIDYGFSQRDQILSPKQVGSTFKPITFLTALKQGNDPCDFYDNTLQRYSQYDDWMPRNADHIYGGSYSMHGALAYSVNTVSVLIQLQTGNAAVLKQAQQMGIETVIPNVPSMVLGTGEIPLFEMVRSYAAIANGGRSIKPFSIARIEDQNGAILFEATPADGDRIAPLDKVKIVQQMMAEVLTEGTGKGIRAFEIPFKLIGKTGTTQNNSDGWFIACSPELVVGAWVGTMDKRVQFGYGSGARTAMPMVASVFKSLSTWKRPWISSFEFANDFFACPAYSELEAELAEAHYASDSVYLMERLHRDSLLSDSLLNSINLSDSILIGQQVPDSLPKDNL